MKFTGLIIKYMIGKTALQTVFFELILIQFLTYLKISICADIIEEINEL